MYKDRCSVRKCNNDKVLLDKLNTTPPPQIPKRVLQVKIFQNDRNNLENNFNKFMIDNIDNDIEIYKIDTDTSVDGYTVNKITVFYYINIKNTK